MNEEGKRRYQSITGAVICIAQVCRYDILYTFNQLARAMPKQSKANMGMAKPLLRYTDFSITYKQGGFQFAAFSDKNWGEGASGDIQQYFAGVSCQ